MSFFDINKIQMVDLKGQYLKIKEEIQESIFHTIESSNFIKGEAVNKFESELAKYLNTKYVISCGNGTDALQIALMALELEHGDEVILPAFTYPATLEVILLLGLKPVLVDVNQDDFNINVDLIESKISSKTRVIMPVHLFGQQANTESIRKLADDYNLFVIEDNAQSIGSKTNLNKDRSPIGHISCTSFFPSKNLGAYGDGGALYTNDEFLAQRIRMIANHGQNKKYHHELIGVNSRLDAMQAAILSVKLKYLDGYINTRKEAAKNYNFFFKDSEEIKTPKETENSDHVYHQYTMQIDPSKRAELIKYLRAIKIPTQIYYPIPLHKQNAYAKYVKGNYPVAEQLTKNVLSLPIHSEMSKDLTEYIASNIIYFFEK